MNVKLTAMVAGGLVLAMAGVAQASPAALTPSQKTCAAFWKWDHDRTGANLNVLMTASESAPWQRLGLDVGVVYFDARGHDRTDLNNDAAGVAGDCRGQAQSTLNAISHLPGQNPATGALLTRR